MRTLGHISAKIQFLLDNRVGRETFTSLVSNRKVQSQKVTLNMNPLRRNIVVNRLVSNQIYKYYAYPK